jgi:aquaglyceroporin related protein
MSAKDDITDTTHTSHGTETPPEVSHMEHQKNAGGSRYPDYIDGEEEREKLLWSRIRRFLREPLAEFFGVMVMLMFGDGSVAQVVLSNGVKGQYQSISWGWG